MTPHAPARRSALRLVALAAFVLCPLAGEAWAEAPRSTGRPKPAPTSGDVRASRGDAAAKGGPPARVAQKGGELRGAKGAGSKGSGAKAAEAKGRGPKAGDAGKRRRAGRRGSAPAHESTHQYVPSLAPTGVAITCPDEMVAVAGRFCVDRYEATFVENDGGELLSPYYPPSPKLAVTLLESWSRAREDEPDGTLARFMPLPVLPAHHQIAFRPKAMAWPGSVPSAYVSGDLAAEACAAAGKRLCKEVEWVTACRGEKNTAFPYGPRYVQNACNVFREDHPARLLHNDFSNGLLDPRLNLVQSEGKDLLRVTGGTPACVSRWGDDGIFDMVGNLDEWVDDPQGAFVGGFYSRATRNGCDSRVGAHPRSYFDYSTGVRCCKDP
jgi:sulfatase-modifying factor enzyme 1